ncbi:hypothetical protein PSTG_18879 [Puccinia striiformis f. sp. tritici PST-78]|uniref:Uncharacterized protein n=1 Tax=Puccinia striiformis f. sp. tritici PST-78 TaxID=1165861 RepID=A0A0L0UL76_9BASI|nr:hypothetical protein PSTG_18879 [Puccinia striiformis f. sp. tritici PST-78]
MLCHGEDYNLLRNLDMLREGRIDPTKPEELLLIRDKVKENINKAFLRNEKAYNLRAINRNFEIGQKVLRRNFCQSNLLKNFTAKLAPTFIPAIIREKKGSHYYLLEDANGKNLGTYHAKDIISC